jgi:hypothetical protein
MPQPTMLSLVALALMLIFDADARPDMQSAAGSSLQAPQPAGQAVVPDRVIRLFNGRDLSV